MQYSTKRKQYDILSHSLNKLLVFAFAEPKLPVQERRAIVESIYRGASQGEHHHNHVILPPTSLNYQNTRQGLLRACLDKMVIHPETAKGVRKAICQISALSSWLQIGLERQLLDRRTSIFYDFAKKICPEDARQNPSIPIIDAIGHQFHRQANREFGRKLGMEYILDHIVMSANHFYRKYRGR